MNTNILADLIVMGTFGLLIFIWKNFFILPRMKLKRKIRVMGIID